MLMVNFHRIHCKMTRLSGRWSNFINYECETWIFLQKLHIKLHSLLSLGDNLVTALQCSILLQLYFLLLLLNICILLNTYRMFMILVSMWSASKMLQNDTEIMKNTGFNHKYFTCDKYFTVLSSFCWGWPLWLKSWILNVWDRVKWRLKFKGKLQ